MVSLGGDGAFPPGSTVSFKTVLGSTIEGHVVCFDPSLKVLAVKVVGPNGKPVLRMFNMAKISEIKESIGNEASDSIENLIANCTLTNQQVSDRIVHAEARRRVELMEEDVTLEGQKAFVQLRRTLDDVCWKGANISILSSVIVTPPYTANCAQVAEDNGPSKAALNQVKKILSKPFVAERKLTACCPKFD